MIFGHFIRLDLFLIVIKFSKTHIMRSSLPVKSDIFYDRINKRLAYSIFFLFKILFKKSRTLQHVISTSLICLWAEDEQVIFRSTTWTLLYLYCYWLWKNYLQEKSTMRFYNDHSRSFTNSLKSYEKLRLSLKRCMEDSHKHLRWSASQKQLTTFNH